MDTDKLTSSLDHKQLLPNKRQKISLQDLASEGATQMPLNIAGTTQLHEVLAAKIRPENSSMMS